MDGTSQRIEREIWQDRLQVQEQKQVEDRNTLGSNVVSYLATKLAKVKAGHLTAGRYDPIRTHLHHFRDWLGASTAVTSISGKVLTDYHSELLTAISEERLSADYTKDQLATVKSFVQWLWRIEAIEELPRSWLLEATICESAGKPQRLRFSPSRKLKLYSLLQRIVRNCTCC